MKALGKIAGTLLASSTLAALVLGGVALASAPTATSQRPSAPTLPRVFLCGPTILWVCSGPFGPDVLFPGTVCEKVVFERLTGMTCVPYTG